ncbi:LOW QUALITY PROTEIN: HSR1-like GTP-binding protein [Marinobacter adhaerens HP15]|uniref:HSR1-like GTP-binding protein n=1 Tax=Marinobacter adhaerens (strain DSM 23420 / HP15) TaxID=225937 RepID=E4PI66_MARAH|nr:LOW QUALITY PROTEIN: HSR1-like GTP-binding protein [Marinobacter adhaerens HP15]
MTQIPTFAVVGHPNKGKSSVVATLSQNDAIAIALEPGTTRRHQAYPLKVDGQTLYTLVDTPGFQRPRRVMEWLEAHSVSASDHADTVKAFVAQHEGDGRFTDECELLRPLIEGAGIIYVVDGSVPYSAEHEAEMTILRWTGRPSLALINSIGADDYSDTWQAALGQFFQVVRRFDAVRAPFEQHLGLLRAFGQLEPDWETPLEQATHYLSAQRQQRRHQAAVLIAGTLQSMMSYQENGRLPPARLQKPVTAPWPNSCGNVGIVTSASGNRPCAWISNIFISTSASVARKPNWSGTANTTCSRKTAAKPGRSASATWPPPASARAPSVAPESTRTFGSSLGTGALVGGLIGAAGSYFYGDRLALPALNIGVLRDGLKTATFGPVQDSQFGYVVLGRAVDHWWHISHRNHAGRDLLDLEPADHHWLERLEKSSRQEIQKAFDKCRKRRPLDERQRERFATSIEQAMAVYDDWRLNRT